MATKITLNFIAGGHKAVLGTFYKVDKQQLIKYVKQFPLSWVRV